MSAPQRITKEQAVQMCQRNCEMLRLCFNTLQSMIQELNVNRNGLSHNNAFTLAASAKTVYERWEMEKRKLAGLGAVPPSTEFASAAELPFPDELRKEIAAKATASDYYKTIWGNLGTLGGR